MDLSVLATPAYFAAMGVERVVLRRRAADAGPSAADYERHDTLTSLGMGVLSLTTPLTAAIVARAVPFRIGARRGRIGKLVLTVGGVAAVVTTAADAVARRAATDAVAVTAGGPGTVAARRSRRHHVARRMASVGGVTTVVAGGLVAAASAAALTRPTRMWARGSRRDLGTGPIPWAIAMVGWDLGYYLNHRLMHEVRALWAIHVVHHSSERYNLSTALRQPVSSALGVWVPYGLMARIGVRPALIETSRSLNLIYQFWIHTDTIRTLGPAEAVLNTPSHHRVHHGSNRRYLDRNHAGVLIVWDRLFGTFEPEAPDEPVVYGLTRNVGSFHPLVVATHEWRDLLGDVARSDNWRDRLGFVLRGPGWAARRRAETVGRTGHHLDERVARDEVPRAAARALELELDRTIDHPQRLGAHLRSLVPSDRRRGDRARGARTGRR